MKSAVLFPAVSFAISPYADSELRRLAIEVVKQTVKIDIHLVAAVKALDFSVFAKLTDKVFGNNGLLIKPLDLVKAFSDRPVSR